MIANFEDLSEDQLRALIVERDTLKAFYRVCQQRKEASPMAYRDPEKERLRALVTQCVYALRMWILPYHEASADECRAATEPVLDLVAREGF